LPPAAAAPAGRDEEERNPESGAAARPAESPPAWQRPGRPGRGPQDPPTLPWGSSLPERAGPEVLPFPRAARPPPPRAELRTKKGAVPVRRCPAPLMFTSRKWEAVDQVN